MDEHGFSRMNMRWFEQSPTHHYENKALKNFSAVVAAEVGRRIQMKFEIAEVRLLTSAATY